jgi:hypothetical protein
MGINLGNSEIRKFRNAVTMEQEVSMFSRETLRRQCAASIDLYLFACALMPAQRAELAGYLGALRRPRCQGLAGRRRTGRRPGRVVKILRA